MLSGPEIRRQIELGNIVVDPFDPAMLNPNSINVRLAPALVVYDCLVLDCRKPNQTRTLRIPDDGLVLEPGTLYLGSTIEVVGATCFVPRLDGRSSLARLGAVSHLTAGLGDTGFVAQWTAEITVVHPLRVYAGMPFAQFTFEPVQGEIVPYAGKYQGSTGPVASKLHRELGAAT